MNPTPPKKNFFVRYRVLIVGLLGLTFIHYGWFQIANDPAFNPSAGQGRRKVEKIIPDYMKSKSVKQADK